MLTLFLASVFAVASPVATIVDFHDEVTPEQILAAMTNVEATNLVHLSSLTSEDIYSVEMDPVHYRTLQSLVESISADTYYSVPELQSFELQTDSQSVDGTDPDLAKQWHMKAAGFDYVQEKTKKGKGVIVAILDTGFTITKDFDPAHVDLAHARSFVRGEPVDDGHGHGSHCASTVAQWTHNGFAASGLAPEVVILPIKVLSDSGSGSAGGIAAGIDYATEVIVQSGLPGVISMSLGGGMPMPSINDAIDEAIGQGVVVVAAAGNSGGPHDHWPASHPPVMSIGSVGPKGLRAPYSSYGKQLDFMSFGGDKTIPGGGVFQWISYLGKESLQEWQGTSMATPHAAAAIAVLLGEGVCTDAVRDERQTCIEDLIKETAVPPPVGKPAKEYGAGTIDLPRALETAKEKNSGALLVPLAPVIPSEPVEANKLPWPSPSGKLAGLLVLGSVFVTVGLQAVHRFQKSFYFTVLATAVLSSGPLFFLADTNLAFTGLSMFMIPWLEVPEFVLFPGASGFPLWLSCLPLAGPFLLFAPFHKTRGVLAGLLISSAVYLVLNASIGFNPVFWMTTFGSAVWLGLNGCILAGMLFATAEVQAVYEKEKL